MTFVCFVFWINDSHHWLNWISLKKNKICTHRYLVILNRGTRQYVYMSRDMTKSTKWVCAQRRLKSAWASAQSDQSLHCGCQAVLSLRFALTGKLKTQSFFMRTAKTLIRLGGLRWAHTAVTGAWWWFYLMLTNCSLIFKLIDHETTETINVYEPHHVKTNKVACAPAQAQITLGIRPDWSVFAVYMKKAWVLSYPLSAQWRLWSDWADLTVFAGRTCPFVGFVMRWLI